MTRPILSWLLLKNQIDQTGPIAFALKVSVFSLLNILLLTFLFTSARGQGISIESMASQYVYFIPLLALSAAVGSFETELFAGAGENLIFGSERVQTSRILLAISELAVPVLFYVVLFVLTGASLGEWIVLISMIVVFYHLGTAVGFAIGFQHEKAINNFLHAIVWILGFGPGPFLGIEPQWYQAPFPGAQALNGNYIAEILKLSLYSAIAFWFVHRGRVPRNYRVFAK